MDSWIQSTMQEMGYPGVVLFMFLENVFPPIPSEVVMPLAGFIASQGRLALWGVIVAGMLGSVLGAIPLYYLGRWLGTDRVRRWSERHGHWLLLSPGDLDRAERWFDRHAKTTVFLGRLVPGVRSLVSIPAGMAEMALGPFFLLTAGGTALWAGLLALAGHFLGEKYQSVSRWIGPVTYVVIGGLLLWYLIYAWRRHRQKSSS
jgi:membrane protein DedA with SNARE-associated domain